MTLRYTALLCTLTLVLTTTAQPPLAWARNLGNFETDPTAVATDPQGNVYLCGTFFGTGDFDPGTGNVTLVAAGFSDVFVCKLTASGQLVWARSIGGPGTEQSIAMDVDAQGNILIAGQFSGTCDFDPGPEVNNLQAAGVWDMFVVKLDTEGDHLWAAHFGDDANEYANDIVVDAIGDVFLSGSYSGTVDFDPGADVSALTSGPFSSTVLLKLSSAGAFLRAQQLDFTSGAVLSVDADGGLLVAGSFNGTKDMDPGTTVLNLTSAGMEDAFVIQLNTNGALLWAKRFGGDLSETVKGICTNTQGDVILGGTFESTAQLVAGNASSAVSPVGENDLFVLHLDDVGGFIRVHQVGWLDYDTFGAVVSNTDDHIFVTGSVRGPVDMDPGPGTFELEDTQSTDAFVLELDANGDFIWASAVSGDANDVEIGADLAIDAAGYLITCGRFLGTADMDPGPSALNLITTAGTAYIQKLGSGGTSTMDEDFTPLQLHPNPTSNRFTVQHLPPNTPVELFNAQGILVRHWQVLGATAVFSLQDLPNGVYMLRIHDGEHVRAVRVVKE